MTEVRKVLARVVCISMALFPAGCRRPQPPPAETNPADENTMPEDIPGVDQEDAGAGDIVVKGTYDRGERETYRHDPKFPRGTLLGGCRFAGPVKVKIPPEEIIDLDKTYPIKDPRPKEVAYYKTMQIKEPWSWQRLRRRRRIWVIKRGETFIPCNVVVMLRDVKVGPMPPLGRATMVVRQGQLTPGDAANGGGNGVQFAPLHDRLQLTTWDNHPCHLVLRRHVTDEKVFEATVRYVQTDDRKLANVHAGHLAYKPVVVASDPIRRCGLYVLSCRRHPWQRAFLWVVDNPYVTTTVWKVYKNPLCNFTLAGVPAGKHTVEVWHPIFEPVQRTFEVEIEANTIKEVMVHFKPPTSWPVKR